MRIGDKVLRKGKKWVDYYGYGTITDMDSDTGVILVDWGKQGEYTENQSDIIVVSPIDIN